MSFAPDITFHDVKIAYSKKQRLSLSSFHLLYNGMFVDDNSTLYRTGVANEDMLVVRMLYSPTRTDKKHSR